MNYNRPSHGVGERVSATVWAEKRVLRHAGDAIMRQAAGGGDNDVVCCMRLLVGGRREAGGGDGGAAHTGC